MELVINILLLGLGFVVLIKGADFFVEGSSSVARYFKVPGVIIGLTIVAMGTSAPELAVSVLAGIRGSNELAVSNVIGSNIFNLLMVLGICAVLKPLPVDSSIRKRDFPISLLGTLLVIFLGGNLVLSGKCEDIHNPAAEAGTIFRWNGFVLLAVFVLYLIYTIWLVRKNRTESKDDKKISVGKSVIFIIGGLAGIIIGGQLVVNSAKTLAAIWGMSETLIGLTIVAIGTSLPELVTSIVASRKGQNGMAIGNVVGSNIFNLLFILGVSGLIHPIGVTMASFVDMGLLLCVSLVVYAFVCSSSKVNRAEGIVMVCMYIAYTTYAIIR